MFTPRFMTPKPSIKRAWVRGAALALTLAFAASLGCSENPPTPDAGAAPPVVNLDPVPAPADLAAQIFVAAPQDTWKKVRATVGGPAMLLPSTPSGLVGTLIGLPVTAIGEIDENLPIFGAIALTPAALQEKSLTLSNSNVVLGIHVRSGGRLIDLLTRGEAPRFTNALDSATSIAHLTPKTGSGGGISIGVLGNYLLVSNNPQALTALGPYVARTMPKGDIPKDDIAAHITDKTLSEFIVPMLGDRVMAQKSALGELAASAFLPTKAIGKLKEIAPDLKDAKIAIKIDENRTRIQLKAAPKSPNGPAAAALSQMATGDLKPLIEMPADTILGILDRDTPESRAASVASYADTIIRALGGPENLSEADKESISAAWKAISEARGEYTAMGLAFASTGPVGYARMPAPDEEKLSKALRQFMDISKRKTMKDALLKYNLKVTSKKTVIENIEGDAERLRFERKESKVSGLPEGVPLTIDFYWLIRGKTLYAAAGYEPKQGLTGFLDAGQKNNWGGIPEIKNTIELLGDEISFALLIDPLRFVASRAGKPSAASPAPIVLSVGKNTKESKEMQNYSMEIYLSSAAIRELVKHRDALMPKD